MNSSDPSRKISVIIPVKNGEKFLAQALDSVLLQTVQAAEILVVAGQSSDSSLDIAAAYPQVKLINQYDDGLANARNLGLERSQGALITFLDHDDLWTADKLERQLQLMTARPAVQYCIGYLALRPSDQQQPSPPSRMLGVTPGCLMARRELFEQIGRFDPAYKIGCDHDWFSRARDAQIPTAILPQVLLHKRLHTSNLSQDFKTYRREMLHITRSSISRKGNEEL